VVSAVDTGAQDFLDAVWPTGDLYIDEEEAFKTELGGVKYRMWWLLRPSVVSKAVSYVSRFGSGQDDISDKKTQLTGGALVIKNGEVVYTHKETTSFDNGDAREMLAAVLGKTVGELTIPETTPAQYDAVCTRETADACGK